MAERKSIEERIAALEERESQLKAQKKKLKAQQSQRERKARTKRLIETGAVVEKALGVDFTETEDRKALLEVLTETRTTQNGHSYTLSKMIVDALQKKVNFED